MKQGRFALKGHTNFQQTSSEHTQTVSTKVLYTKAWPFALASFFYIIYFQSDIILVNYLSGETEAGYYSVAFTIMSAIMMIPGILYQKFLLPKIHRWSNHDRNRFYQVYRIGNQAMLFSGLILLCILYFATPFAIKYLLGPTYHHSIELIQILAFTIPFLFLASNLGAILVTQHHMKLKATLMGMVALLNIGLNLLLIPMFAAKGAVIATLICSLALLLLYFFASKKVFYQDTHSLQKQKTNAVN
jgi:O-antigen/teichoic acid export membrane protein